MTYRRLLLAVLALGLLACLYVGVRRERHEHRANRVEIVMDDADFASLARSYAYDQRAFLIALRRAGLTSLAVQEELGSQVAASPNAAVYSGTALLDQSKLFGFRDPVFARLAAHGLRADEVYLVAYDAATAQRYARQLALKFSPQRGARAAQRRAGGVCDPHAGGLLRLGGAGSARRARRAWRASWVCGSCRACRTTSAFADAQIDALVHDAADHHDAHTVIFFGLRNQVLGYPDTIDATANALRAAKLDFGTVETYDVKQNQAGSETLARDLPDRTVRVQAIAKTEQDKLRPEEIVQRYDLGVRERNVRVVYLRPFAHQWGERSIEATNVELVRQIAQNVRAAGLRVGTASPFDRFVTRPWEIALASLAVPAILLLLLAEFGLGDRRWLIAFVARRRRCWSLAGFAAAPRHGGAQAARARRRHRVSGRRLRGDRAGVSRAARAVGRRRDPRRDPRARDRDAGDAVRRARRRRACSRRR